MRHEEGTQPGVEVERVLGRYTRGLPGPLVVVLAGLHGNEPAGTEAAISVIDELERLDLPLAGRVLALSGNREALRRGCRYLNRDLNRCWTDDRIDRIRAGDPANDDSEEREMRELLAVLEAEFDEDYERAFVLDLHSTSALGAPFSILADTLQNRAIARFLPIPVIMGLEERIEGPLLSWLAGRGHAAIVVEGGQHEDPSTVQNHEAAIRLTLVAAGAIEYDACPAIDEGYRRSEVGVPRAPRGCRGQPQPRALPRRRVRDARGVRELPPRACGRRPRERPSG